MINRLSASAGTCSTSFGISLHRTLGSALTWDTITFEKSLSSLIDFPSKRRVARTPEIFSTESMANKTNEMKERSKTKLLNNLKLRNVNFIDYQPIKKIKSMMCHNVR